MSVHRLLVVHDDDLGMRFGGDHPTDRRRHRLAVALCREAGILDAPGVALEPAPGPLPDEVLARVFAPAFIRAVHRYSDAPMLAAEPEAAQWGIGGDNNAYDGMHHDSARACAACDAGARAVGEGRARSALVPAGGAHHGMANRAGGSASTTRPPSRSRRSATPASSGSPTSTSTCTTATAPSGSTTTIPRC